jgi:GLPGLI family protein
MKIVSILVLALMVFAGYNASAQKAEKPFTGMITYSVTPNGEIEPDMKAQLPTEVVIYYSGGKMRMENKTSMGTAIVISDKEKMEQIVLIDMMGTKMALQSTKEELEKALSESEPAKIVVTEETKTIAGMTCKKVEITEGEKTSTYWATFDLNIPNPNWTTSYKDLQGVLLEYVQPISEEASYTLTATTVKKMKVKGTLFTIPAGYQVMSMTEFRKMMGGE